MELAAAPHGHGAHTDLVALQEHQTVGVGASKIVTDDDVTVDGVDPGGLVEPQIPSHHEIPAGDGVGVAAGQFDSSGSSLVEEPVGGNRGGRIVAAADDLAAQRQGPGIRTEERRAIIPIVGDVANIDLPGDRVGTGHIAQRAGVGRVGRGTVEESARRAVVRVEENDVAVGDIHVARGAVDFQNSAKVSAQVDIGKGASAQRVGMGHAKHASVDPDPLQLTERKGTGSDQNGIPNVKGVVAAQDQGADPALSESQVIVASSDGATECGGDAVVVNLEEVGFSHGWCLQRSRAAQLNGVGPAEITTSPERDDIARRIVVNPGVGDGIGAGQIHAFGPQGAVGSVESQSAGAKRGLVAEGEDTALKGGSVGVGVGVVEHQGAGVVPLDEGAAGPATGDHGVDDEIVEGGAIVDREGSGGVAKAEVSVDHRLAADVVSHGAPQGERAGSGADGSAGHGEGADAVTLVVGCQIEEAAMVHGDGDSANLVRAGGGSVAHRGGARERVVNRQRAVDCGRRAARLVEFEGARGHGDGSGSGVCGAAPEDQGAITHLGVVLGRKGGVQRQPAVRLHADGGGAAHGDRGRVGANDGVAVDQFQGPLAVIIGAGAVDGKGLVTQVQRAGDGVNHQSGAGFDRGPTRSGAEGGIAGNFQSSVAHGHGA